MNFDIIKKYDIRLHNNEVRKRQLISTNLGSDFDSFIEEFFNGDLLDELITGCEEYVKTVAFQPRNKYRKGMVSDETYYEYWGKLNEIEYYHSNVYIVNLYDQIAEVSFEYARNYSIQIPLRDFIEIIQVCKDLLIND